MKGHRDVIQGMSKTTSTMGYYIVLALLVNLPIGSASAKWALLAPIFVPMLMQLGLSPELSQAAYRIGDSTTNIITPLMRERGVEPYFLPIRKA